MADERTFFIICIVLGAVGQCYVAAQCGGRLTDPEGNVTSPNYPENYPPGSFCFWEIHAPMNDVIILEFHEFDLEFSSKGCDYDYVIVVDANKESRFCGNDIPARIRSQGYKITVGFITDDNSQHKGFWATYRTINRLEPVVTTSTTPAPTTTATHKGCGGQIYDRSASIVSPGYPDVYPPNEVCIWSIQPRYGQQIYLTIDLLDIQDSDRCADDYLQVLDADLNILGRFCGDVTPSLVLVADKRMTVVFKTDDLEARRGFKLTYTDMEPLAPPGSNPGTFPPTENPPLTTQTYLVRSTPRPPPTRQSSSTPHRSSQPPTGTPRPTAPNTKTIKGTGSSTGSTIESTTTVLVNASSTDISTGLLIGIGFGAAVVVLIIIIVVTTICIRRKKQHNPLLGARDYSKMAPPLPYGSSDFGAKPYMDSDSVSNAGYEGIRPGKTALNEEGDAGMPSNLSEVSTPWGTAKRSQLRELSPEYHTAGSRPQLGLPESRIGTDMPVHNVKID